MEEVLVILTLDSVPSQVISFKGEHDEISKKAEEQFLKICAEYIRKFKNYTHDDKEAILEDGYEVWDHVNSVAIHWMA
jgi:hypothetical protein